MLATTLNIMARDRSPETIRAILRQVQAPNFESRRDAHQRLLFTSLAEMGDDTVVPTLQALVEKGGWFARPTPQRLAAAQALFKIGTTKAMEVLEQGVRSSHEAVRQACLDALSGKQAA